MKSHSHCPRHSLSFLLHSSTASNDRRGEPTEVLPSRSTNTGIGYSAYDRHIHSDATQMYATPAILSTADDLDSAEVTNTNFVIAPSPNLIDTSEPFATPESRVACLAGPRKHYITDLDPLYGLPSHSRGAPGGVEGTRFVEMGDVRANQTRPLLRGDYARHVPRTTALEVEYYLESIHSDPSHQPHSPSASGTASSDATCASATMLDESNHGSPLSGQLSEESSAESNEIHASTPASLYPCEYPRYDRDDNGHPASGEVEKTAGCVFAEAPGAWSWSMLRPSIMGTNELDPGTSTPRASGPHNPSIARHSESAVPRSERVVPPASSLSVRAMRMDTWATYTARTTEAPQDSHFPIRTRSGHRVVDTKSVALPNISRVFRGKHRPRVARGP